MTITAQEYLVRIGEPLSELGRELLATLRHHEANESDAALGALVRRIREHPKLGDPYVIRPVHHRPCFSLDSGGLSVFLSHLDSLLPKEPEWTDAPSGYRYRTEAGKLYAKCEIVPSSQKPDVELEVIRIEDAPVVAALMEASRGK